MPLPKHSIFNFTAAQRVIIRARVHALLHPLPLIGCTVYENAWTDNNGYSKVGLFGVSFFVHRVTWELEHGQPIPAGMLLDHHCRFHPCCDPAHLEPVTVKVNTHRGQAILFKRAAA